MKKGNTKLKGYRGVIATASIYFISTIIAQFLYVGQYGLLVEGAILFLLTMVLLTWTVFVSRNWKGVIALLVILAGGMLFLHLAHMQWILFLAYLSSLSLVAWANE